MAKKKTNNVVINDQELVPTTLGVYSNKAKNPIIVFLILAIFLSIAFFMPDIQKSINKFLGKDNETSNNGGGGNTSVVPDSPDKPDISDNPVEEDTKYDITSDTTIDLNTFTIDGINHLNATLSLNVNAKSGTDLTKYFIELYDSDNMFLGRNKLSDEVLSAGSSKTYNYIIPNNSAKMSIVKKSLDDYPDIKLSYNDQNEAILTCNNANNEEYIYTFKSDQLSKIIYSYRLSSTASNYNEYYARYMTFDTKNKVLEGVTSTFINSDNGFDYTLILNLDSISTDNIKEINLEGLFKIKTQAKEVKFIIESKNYTCKL